MSVAIGLWNHMGQNTLKAQLVHFHDGALSFMKGSLQTIASWKMCAEILLLLLFCCLFVCFPSPQSRIIPEQVSYLPSRVQRWWGQPGCTAGRWRTWWLRGSSGGRSTGPASCGAYWNLAETIGLQEEGGCGYNRNNKWNLKEFKVHRKTARVWISWKEFKRVIYLTWFCICVWIDVPLCCVGHQQVCWALWQCGWTPRARGNASTFQQRTNTAGWLDGTRVWLTLE